MITVQSVRYQRNGICGVGLYAVAFTYPDPGYRVRHMVGFVIPPDDADAGQPTGKPEIYGVMDPSEPAMAWRGDHFIDEMWTACQIASANGSAHREPAKARG